MRQKVNSILLMPGLSLQDLKIHILKAIAAAPHFGLHKYNLLGRGSLHGDLERQLGVTFDKNQRALAVQAFDQLRAASLIRPTYSDSSDPENWVEVTESGRTALEKGFFDQLDMALKAISSHLVDIRWGAWSALASAQPDSLRQAAHSGRELIDQVLKLGASDDEVKCEAGFVSDPSSKSGITRRQRLNLLMKRHRGAGSKSDLAIAEEACDLVLAIDQKLMAFAHSRSGPHPDDVRDSLEAAEIALRRILVGPTDHAEVT